MHRPLLTLAAALTFCLPAHAHDFWLGPHSYHLDKAGVVPVSIMVGHPVDRARWALDPHRVTSLKSFGPDGVSDHQSRMKTLTPNGDLLITLPGDGTHILTIETTSSVSLLAAEKFNAYLEEEGLTPIKTARKKSNSEDHDGREIYSRRGKALVQVGPVNAHTSDAVTRPLGMTLEIVPHQNPYRLETGAPLVSKVYYRGEAVEGVTIGLISLDTDRGLVEIQKTDAHGDVSFDRPVKGNWMLHAVWSDQLEDTVRGDYDTVFSSLSFGFKQ